VIVHHLTGHGQALERFALALPGAGYALVRGGYLAVTTFFVLSGFVLARGYAGTRWNGRSLRRYAVARFARVYPIYLLSLLIVAPFIAADRAPAKARLLSAHAVLVQGWFGSLPVNWNTPAWSLSCEAFFYALFPLAAVCICRGGWWRTLAVAAAACCLTRVLWRIGVSDGTKPLIHLADFLMGVAAARAFSLGGWKISGAWLSLPALTAAAVLIARPELLAGTVDLNTALRPLNALLLIGLALGGGPAARALSSSAAVYLGKASYAMYILHIPLLWWYLRWSRGFSAGIYVGGVIAVSAAVYSLVEEPANRALRHWCGGSEAGDRMRAGAVR
jgi:peptidoglycan/LPS O-acetylase OafA/YrhL